MWIRREGGEGEKGKGGREGRHSFFKYNFFNMELEKRAPFSSFSALSIVQNSCMWGKVTKLLTKY